MDAVERRKVRRERMDKRCVSTSALSKEEAKKDRKTKNRESAMLSRERKNMKMKSLEEQNHILRRENMELKRLLYGGEAYPVAVSPTGVEASNGQSGEPAWAFANSNHKPDEFIKL
jgi:hypothetical protein